MAAWAFLALLVGVMVYGAGNYAGQNEARDWYGSLGPKVGMAADSVLIVKRGDKVLYVETYFPGGAGIRVLGPAVKVRKDTTMAGWLADQREKEDKKE